MLSPLFVEPDLTSLWPQEVLGKHSLSIIITIITHSTCTTSVIFYIRAHRLITNCGARRSCDLISLKSEFSKVIRIYK